MFPLLVALALLIVATPQAFAQQAVRHRLLRATDTNPGKAKPASAWIDLRQNAPGASTTQNAPPWVESVAMVPSQTIDGVSKSIFRIRIAKPTGDYSVLFFRLFF